MYKVSHYPHGTFSSADCSTTDYEASKTFYATIMGWQAHELPLYSDVQYTRFKQDGEVVAVLIPLPEEKIEAGMPSHWKNFVTVDDVDALVDKVTDLGGTVLQEPFDMSNDGRMMVIQDPVGGTLALWQAKNHIGFGLVNTYGAMLWNELMTREPKKAMDFYGKLFGWEFHEEDHNPGYYMIMNNGRMNGAILGMGDEYGDMPSSWMVYYNVPDIESTKEKIKANGGTIHVEAEATGVGPFAVVSDPQGATFYVMQADKVDTWDEN